MRETGDTAGGGDVVGDHEVALGGLNGAFAFTFWSHPGHGEGRRVIIAMEVDAAVFYGKRQTNTRVMNDPPSPVVESHIVLLRGGKYCN